MTYPKIWLSSPHMGGSEIKYVNDAFDENWVAPLGPNVNGFEYDIEKYLHQNNYVAALSTGTAALHLALIVLDVKPGDSVICQTMTFSATAFPISYVGAVPIFVDSEEETWNMSPEYLEEAIRDQISLGKKPKVIILVHIYGMPAKIKELSAIAQKYNIPIIEDAAEALGSSYKNQKCGTFGEIAILSFNGNKIITTSGGGAIVCKTKEEKDKAVFLATQSRECAPHYEHKEIGYNYRMSNISAGIGRGQMEVLDSRVTARRNNHFFYQDIFQDFKGITIFSEPSGDYYSNHWLSAIIIDSKITGFTREDLRLTLERNNIESRPVWKPMHLQPVFKNSLYYGGKIAENLFLEGLCLPSGSNLTDLDKNRIKTIILSLKK